jgi:hypothetical protein
MKHALACAGLLVLGGCAARQQHAESPTSRHVGSAQRESQQALERAAEAQKRASEQGERVARAEQEVRDAQRRLSEAQDRLKAEQEEAEQLQRQAVEARREAMPQAEASQREATQALTRQGEQVQREQHTFSGQLTGATPDSIVVTPQAGEPMTFKVTDRTQVQIDGRRASSAEIRQGGDARVSYQMSGSQPTAVVVQVMTGDVARPLPTEPGRTAPAPGEPSVPGTPGEAAPERR